MFLFFCILCVKSFCILLVSFGPGMAGWPDGPSKITMLTSVCAQALGDPAQLESQKSQLYRK